MSIIEVNGVSKEYCLGQLRSMKQSMLNALDRLRGNEIARQEPFKALDDVSFSVEEGEVLGIIGTNGAGKSTLLKLLANITKPTRGKVNVRGAVAPLIEVGAGLHPELTGRENVYLNGAIMGIPRKVISRKFDEIVAFAELEQFIDTPVKRYSSGMAVRLGFSIATSVDADILIIDEVLAVGDLAFQRKCFDKMESLIKCDGRTVLIVGHNIRQLERMCSRVMLLNKGKIQLDGQSTEVCNAFFNMTNIKLELDSKQACSRINPQHDSGEILVEAIELNDDNGHGPAYEFELHKSIHIDVRFSVNSVIEYPEIVVGFHTSDFVYIVSASSAVVSDRPHFEKGANCVRCSLKDMVLRPGNYSLRLAFIDKYRRIMWYGENVLRFKVTSNQVDVTKLPELGLVDLPFEWIFSRGTDRSDSFRKTTVV